MIGRVVAHLGVEPDPVPHRPVLEERRLALQQPRPRVVGQRRVVVPRQVRWQHGDLRIGFVLHHLERHRQVQDRPARLSGDDLAGRERPTVTQPFDLVADRLLVAPGADEIGVQRMSRPVGRDRQRRGPKRLGDDLPAEEPATPRVARSDPT